MTVLKLETSEVFGSDGSGNQKKVWIDNKLIKLNSKYREASKEVSASILGKAFGLDIVQYIKREYLYNGNKYTGCECDSYLSTGDTTITLADILNFYNIDIPLNMSAKEYFNITINCICRYTNINYDAVVNYIMKMLVFDFIICNQDRHLTNIEFIYNDIKDSWRFSPLFDHGQSFLLSDGGLTIKQIENRMYKLKMKPFSSNLYKNLVDIEQAKRIVKQFLVNVKENYISVDNIPINSFHKQIVKIQMQRLLNK